MTRPVVFDPAELSNAFGRRPIALEHVLADHPLLTLDALVELASVLPPRSVEHHHSLGVPLVRPDVNPDVVDAPPAEVTRGIADNGTWMVLWHVEQVPAYRALLDETVAEARALLPRREGPAGRSDAYIFVSAPGTVTPAHIDPEHNLLLQIRGTKQFVIGRYPDAATEQRTAERYYGGAHRNLDWLPPEDQTFTLHPGTGVYVPYLRPHWVFNGPEVSIALSAAFQAGRRDHWAKVHHFNDRLRRHRLTPRPPGSVPTLDLTKRVAEGVCGRTERLLHGRALREQARERDAAVFAGPGGTRIR